MSCGHTFLDYSVQTCYTDNDLPATSDTPESLLASTPHVLAHAGRYASMHDNRQHPSTCAPAPATPSFDELYACYEQPIYALILRMVGEPEEAVDLTAQTFLHALRAYRQFRGDAQASTWLYRIAVNLCKNHFRTRDRQARHPVLSLDTPADDTHVLVREVEDPAPSPHGMMERLELQAAIHEALHQLAPDLRMAILLRDVQGFAYHEVAELTGCSLDAVKSRIYRARGMLRKMLAPLLDREVESAQTGRLRRATPEE